MRRDVHVDNDAGGFSILSTSVVDKIIDDDREDDARFVDAGEAILVELVGDDTFDARVVVGEPLTADEEAQWVARLTWELKVPCGRMLICGGFDPDVLHEWRDDGEAYMACEVDVPPGTWRVDVYTYVSTMNGDAISQDWDEPIGAWFRRVHPERPMPHWLASRLQWEPESDPGNEDDWEDVPLAAREGRLAIESRDTDDIGFLIHLQPLEEGVETSEHEGGWFEAALGARRPEEFPLGVPSTLESEPIIEEQNEFLGLEKYSASADPIEDSVPALELTADSTLHPVEGGPVEHPVGDLWLVHRLGWFCYGGAALEVSIELPDDTPSPWETLPGAKVEVVNGTVRLGFENPVDRWELSTTLMDLVDDLAVVPDGSIVEVALADRDEEQLSCFQRYRGPVKDGMWLIGESSPELTADVLRSALALGREVDEARAVNAHDEGEAERLEAAASQDFWLEGGVRRDGLRLYAGRDHDVLCIANVAFRDRFRNSFDVEEGERREAALAEVEYEHRQMMDDLNRSIDRAVTKADENAGLFGGDVILRGQAAVFCETNLEESPDLDSVQLDELGETLDRWNYRLVGDMFINNEVMMRAWLDDDDMVWFVLLRGLVTETHLDLYTVFEDGTSVTTTTNPSASEREGVGAYMFSMPGAGVDDLLMRHMSAIAERGGRGLAPRCTKPELRSLAEAMDEFLLRTLTPA